MFYNIFMQHTFFAYTFNTHRPRFVTVFNRKNGAPLFFLRNMPAKPAYYQKKMVCLP